MFEQEYQLREKEMEYKDQEFHQYKKIKLWEEEFINKKKTEYLLLQEELMNQKKLEYLQWENQKKTEYLQWENQKKKEYLQWENQKKTEYIKWESQKKSEFLQWQEELMNLKKLEFEKLKKKEIFNGKKREREREVQDDEGKDVSKKIKK